MKKIIFLLILISVVPLTIMAQSEWENRIGLQPYFFTGEISKTDSLPGEIHTIRSVFLTASILKNLQDQIYIEFGGGFGRAWYNDHWENAIKWYLAPSIKAGKTTIGLLLEYNYIKIPIQQRELKHAGIGLGFKIRYDFSPNITAVSSFTYKAVGFGIEFKFK